LSTDDTSPRREGIAGDGPLTPTVEKATAHRMPEFFIVGHAKSGTTALYEMLRRHPEIYMPESKEPWFFASDMRPRFPPPRAGVPPQTLDEYLSLFSGARPEQRVGEASSSYLWSGTAASRIAEVQPAARVIAILREPASFLRSLHLQLLQSHVEVKKDLKEAIGLEALRREGRCIPRRSHRPQLLQYSQHVRYVEQLRRYHDRFPADQILVLIYDDFRQDNMTTVRRVLDFLEVRDPNPVDILEVNPTTRRMRSQQLDDLVYSVSVGQGAVSRSAKAAIKAFTPEKLRRDLLRVTQRRIVQSTAPPPDEDFMTELRHRFKPEVEALSKYLDRDLIRLWSYDRLG
jgi:Sulfotransferase family